MTYDPRIERPLDAPSDLVFETAEDRDSFGSGTPSWIDAVWRIVESRARGVTRS